MPNKRFEFRFEIIHRKTAISYDERILKVVKMTKQNRVYESIVDLIASPENPTPMVKITEKVNPNTDFKIYLKLERYNPFGSIKDRIALSMLEGLEIKQGNYLVEPSSGNTGIALAALANAKGIPIEIAVPERIPEEKKTLLRLLGVQTLWEADDKLCPVFPNEGARGLVNAMLKSKGGEKYISPNQYENELNVQAHYETTGPEIWNQTDGKVDYFFAGFGTCGTITGVGKYLKSKKSSVNESELARLSVILICLTYLIGCLGEDHFEGKSAIMFVSVMLSLWLARLSTRYSRDEGAVINEAR